MLSLSGDAFAQPAPSASPATPPSAQPPPPASNGNGRREPTAGDLATARTALREGLILRDKGETADALARLASAYDLVPTPVTGFELGKTHMMLGHILQASELFKKVVRMPMSMEESSRSQTSRDEAARLSKELEPRIPTLRLKLTLPPNAFATVRIDEEPINLTGAETVRAVDPGPHDVIAKAGDGPEEKVHVEVAESEIKDVSLSPKWVPPKEPPAGKGRDIIYVRTTNPLAFIGFGIAAASIITGTITFFVFLDARADAKNLCGSSYCPPAQGRGAAVLPTNAIADTEFENLNTRSGVAGLITIVAGLTAVVFTGVGIVGVARPVRERVVSESSPPPAPPPPPSVKPVVGLGALGVVGTF